MSYQYSAALQAAVYDQLANDAGLAGLVGGAIYDAMPSGTVPALYVALGPEKVRDRSDISGRLAEHEFVVSVVTTAAGFASAKEAAGAVSGLIHDAQLSLTHGILISVAFQKATATREGDGSERRIDLTFRARVAD